MSCDLCGKIVEHALELKEIVGVDDAIVEACLDCYEQLVVGGFFERPIEEQKKILANIIEDLITKRISKPHRMN